MNAVGRAIFSFWLVVTSINAMATDFSASLFGLPFWVRWIAEAFACIGTLWAIWERRR